jgi:two-component system copper resistance phosphate regulon response regulator CusR
MKILLIEDESAIAGIIKQGLEEAHYRVVAVGDGAQGLAMASEGLYSLIILDIMLPGMDGWTVCQRLRELRNSTPILMLTARDNVRDKVRGLEIGADDYLSKPFNFSELLARVNALIRRDRMHKTKVITIGDLIIDTAARRVERAGKEVALTEREFTLLEALASHEGQVLTRESIQERVWLDEDSYSNTVDVYIGTLRKKIDAAYDEKLIRTVHGVGYTLRRSSE